MVHTCMVTFENKVGSFERFKCLRDASLPVLGCGCQAADLTVFLDLWVVWDVRGRHGTERPGTTNLEMTRISDLRLRSGLHNLDYALQ